ncbi:MAG: GNAT family N-acetyltransferase [Gordonia paraffinivorans]
MDVERADVAAPVAALRWEWARELDSSIPDGPSADFVAAVAEWMADATRTVWLATDDGPVGMVCLTEYTRMPSPSDAAGGRWGYLGHLYVRPDARGVGVGESLVRELLAESTRRGHTKVVLSPTAPSVPLYERCGFVGGTDLMLLRP